MPIFRIDFEDDGGIDTQQYKDSLLMSESKGKYPIGYLIAEDSVFSVEVIANNPGEAIAKAMGFRDKIFKISGY